MAHEKLYNLSESFSEGLNILQEFEKSLATLSEKYRISIIGMDRNKGQLDFRFAGSLISIRIRAISEFDARYFGLIEWYLYEDNDEMISRLAKTNKFDRDGKLYENIQDLGTTYNIRSPEQERKGESFLLLNLEKILE